MQIARFSFPSLLAFTLLIPAAAHAQISTQGSVRIEQRAGASVLQDVIIQSNIMLTVIGRPGDTVSVGVPGSVNVTSQDGRNMQLATTSDLVYSSGAILSEDTLSVSIGAVARPQAGSQPGVYDGLMVVLAQYN
jgi:hypothetical protein